MTRTVHIIPDVTAPSVPSITIAQITPNTINASWSPSTDDQAVSHYLYGIASSATATPSTATTSTQTGDTVLTDGTWYVTTQAVDVAGNVSTSSQASIVIDTTAPLITLTGASSITQFLHTTYVDQGATALDLQDGNVTTSIVSTGSVDTNTAGDYTITYDVTDTHGNAAAQVTRTVHIIYQPIVSGGSWFVSLDPRGYRVPEPLSIADLHDRIGTSTLEKLPFEKATSTIGIPKKNIRQPLLIKRSSIMRVYALPVKETLSTTTHQEGVPALKTEVSSYSLQKDVTPSSGILQKLMRKIKSLFTF